MYEILNVSTALSANSTLLLHPTASPTTISDDLIAYPWNNGTAVSQELLPNITASVAEAATDWLTTFIATLTTDANNISTITTNYNNNNNNNGDNDNNSSSTSSDTVDNMIAAVTTTATGNCSSPFNLCPNDYFNGHNVTTIPPAVTAMNNNTMPTDVLFDWDDYSRCDPTNPQFNCSRDEFVEYNLGPQRLPLHQVLMVTILYGGIFITGVLGNVLVCVVIVRHPTMHSATNYYLFSLAVSDLLYLLFGLPAEIFLYWHQYPYLFGLPFCKIRAFISEASTYVSVLTIVAFSMERFLAICHPLHLYTMSGFKRAVRIMAAMWIISFISAVPFGLLTNIQYIDYPNDNSTIVESAFCSMMPEPDRFPWIEVSFCVFFVIPMILISILYACMGKQIRDSTTAQLGIQQGSMHRESSHSKSRKAVIRMLAAVVLTFFICWLPFHIQRLWILYARDYVYFQEVNEWMFCITGFAYYVSCTINPILYNVMSHRYRVAFKDILCGKRRTSYFNYTFARDQSSFRETNSNNFDRVHSVRVRSIRHSTTLNDHNSLISANNALWKNAEKQTQNEDIKPLALGTNIVVVVDNGGNVNGRPKVYTEHEAQEGLLRKDHETCI